MATRSTMSRITSQRTLAREAPLAILMPISLVRLLTMYDIKP